MHLLAIVSAAMLLALPASAEVYRCTGTDGRTAFSDQPCGTLQTSSTTHPKAASGASADSVGAYKAPPSMDYKSLPEYPECVKLKAKLDEYFLGPVAGTTGKQAEQARDDLAHYKAICAMVDQGFGRELKEKRVVPEVPKRDADNAAANAARCEAMKNNLAELTKLGPALAKSTDHLNPQEAAARKKEIAGIEKRIPLIAAEIKKSCSAP